MLKLPLPALDDPEGERIPESLPDVVDAHVHLFPDMLFEAIRQWFDQFGWPVRYRFTAPEIVEFLLSKGVSRIVGLHYAHKPGMARPLNEYMAGLCKQYPQLIGTATVFPGERDAPGVLQEALDRGLVGVKLHAHVQCFSMDSPGMHEIYEFCSMHGQPLIMHVGPEPTNPEYDYGCDLRRLCRGEVLEQVLRGYPALRVCVPHLGADEFSLYQRLVREYDTLWLDTTMVIADYLPVKSVPLLTDYRPDRILYGTDFPNIPYAWDRELKVLSGLGLPPDVLAKIAGENALSFFRVEP